MYGPEADSDRQGLYERLRAEHGPVAPVLMQGDVPAWLVLGHRENLDVMRTPSRFTCDSRTWNRQLSADSPLLPLTAWQPLLAFADGKEHARLRLAVTDSLERFNRQSLRRYVTRYANRLVDQFAAHGRADLVEEFAERLPMMVLTNHFGMSEEYGPKLVEAVRDMTRGSATAVSSNRFVVETMSDLVARKRERPGSDFTSWLIGHESNLTDDEVREHLRLTLVAGYEPTVNLIANTLRMVLTDARFRGSLSGGQMTLPDALDQVLWDHPPISLLPTRWAIGDTDLGGRTIRAGDMLLLCLEAGNVDPAIRPDLSASMHGNRSHLAFSAGPHGCPGQDIGRAIADTGVETLLNRLIDLRLAVAEDEVRVTSAWISERLEALPVQFTPIRPTVTATPPPPAVMPGPMPEQTAAPAAEPAAPQPPSGRWGTARRSRRDRAATRRD
ncbi:cytochrome P450 [Streptomyces sp. YC537]|uniref:Cytochrome P450 n=1 Tax=Streptomyces boluensis TaxID=1775135 RepID=A0A964UPK2_9ACTN|nr:cytochrome P450 [Streptomyces boluensis]